MGPWKLHFPHAYRTLGGKPGGTGGIPVPYQQAHIGVTLFDLERDPGETTDVADQHPDVVAKIKELADRMPRTWAIRRPSKRVQETPQLVSSKRAIRASTGSRANRSRPKRRDTPLSRANELHLELQHAAAR